MQLGHVSMRCANPVAAPLGFQILHMNGIHDVSINYCGCEGAKEKNLQLLRRGLYPATQRNAKTCGSFALLQLLHLLALTSKSSTYDFYRALEKATNNTGIHTLKSASRYRPLLRMILQWRHLKMLKRGGRGHDPTGASGTKDGELAVACPSCPHPGINLPDGWESAPEETRYVLQYLLCTAVAYSQFTATFIRRSSAWTPTFVSKTNLYLRSPPTQGWVLAWPTCCRGRPTKATCSVEHRMMM